MSSKSKLRLTESAVEALPIDGRDRIVFDELLSGFGVRITPAGAKIFVAQARVNGKPKRVPLGRHPSMSVADARREARGALEDLRQDKSPAVERDARRNAVEAAGTTVEAFCDRWLAEHVRPKLKPRTAADYEKIVNQNIKPELGRLPLARVTKADVNRIHVAMQRTPRRANYVVSVIRSLMTFAEDVGLRPANSNPARRIKLYAERASERFMSDAEIGRAADAIAACEAEGKIGPHAAAGLRLCLLTGARSGEVTQLEWSHIDFGRRMARLPDSKTGPGRIIYLSEAALEVLKSVKRVGPFVVAGAKPGEPYKNLSRAWIIARGRAGLDDVRLHDLRHTFASVAAARGHSLVMIGKLLGHRVPATTQRYSHLAADPVLAASDELGAAISNAAAPKPATKNNVVRLRAKRTRK